MGNFVGRKVKPCHTIGTAARVALPKMRLDPANMK
jgi:hypothetical protein